MTTETTTPHAGSEWAGAMGDRWAANVTSFEYMISDIGEALLAHAGYTDGESVVDVGCGAGPTSVRLAELVGPQGRVKGVDIAPQLIALANARSGGNANLSFQTLDAQTGAAQGAPFDRLFSRFGVMFFADSVAAFRNMRGWLKPGALMDFAAWGPPAANPWFARVGAILQKHFDTPRPDPPAPGPMRFADIEATIAMLEVAGFSDVTCEVHDTLLPIGDISGTVEAAIAFAMNSGQVAALSAEKPHVSLDAVRADFTAMVEEFVTVDGVRVPGQALFYSARA